MKRGVFKKRGRPLRRRKLTLKGQVTDKMLDEACRAVVFARDGYRCRKTGLTERLQWAHIYSRRYKSVRWDPDNSITLTAGAHLWWHHQPVVAAQWWLSEVGEVFHANLRTRMRAGKSPDKKLMLIWLQQELKRLQRVGPEVSSPGARTG